MQLVVNGEQIKVDNINTIQDLLLTLGYEVNAVAVACDNTFISRSQYAQYEIKNGENLEILLPMQGG